MVSFFSIPYLQVMVPSPADKESKKSEEKSAKQTRKKREKNMKKTRKKTRKKHEKNVKKTRKKTWKKHENFRNNIFRRFFQAFEILCKRFYKKIVLDRRAQIKTNN